MGLAKGMTTTYKFCYNIRIGELLPLFHLYVLCTQTYESYSLRIVHVHPSKNLPGKSLTL